MHANSFRRIALAQGCRLAAPEPPPPLPPKPAAPLPAARAPETCEVRDAAA